MKPFVIAKQRLRSLLWPMLLLTIALSLYHPRSNSPALVEPIAPRGRLVNTSAPLPVSSGSTEQDLARTLQISRPVFTPGKTPLFMTRNWAPPPPPPPPQPAPQAPLIPFRYVGKMLVSGMAPQIYLADRHKIYVVKQGENLDGTYLVDSITDNVVTLIYLPLHQKQIVPIGRN